MTQKPILKVAAALALTASVAPMAQADDNALIDVLLRKGVLSKKEATAIREEMTHTDDSASKIKLSNSLTELKLYGDIRMRYQYEDKDAQLPREFGGGANVSQQSRWRFRLRLNADFKLGDHVFGGVELQTGQASDSANQTFENAFDDYGIFISKVWFGWKPTDWATAYVGKMPNPFYTTDLVWDPDINPTGLAEVIDLRKLFAGEEAISSKDGYSKDGKSYKAPVPIESPWELSLVAGQFIYDDNAEFLGPDSDSSTDAYLFETQLIGSYKFNGFKVTLAPAYLTYINGSVGGLLNTNSFQDSPFVSGATRNLNLLLFPGDVQFKIGSLKTKVYWDFSYNIEGRKRAEDILHLVSLHEKGPGEQFDPDDFSKHHNNIDDLAYLIGIQFGENKKAGDWSLNLNWRQTGISAVDPNLNDNDFAIGELNTRGVKVGVAYNFADFAVGAVTYQYAWNLRDDLFGGEATGDNAIADANKAQMLQVDLTVKF